MNFSSAENAVDASVKVNPFISTVQVKLKATRANVNIVMNSVFLRSMKQL